MHAHKCDDAVVNSHFSRLFATQLSSAVESVDTSINGPGDCCAKCDMDDMCGGFTFDDRQNVCRYIAKGEAAATLCRNCLSFAKANDGGALIQLGVPPGQQTVWVNIPQGLKAVELETDLKTDYSEARPAEPAQQVGSSATKAEELPAITASGPAAVPQPPQHASVNSPAAGAQPPAPAGGSCQIHPGQDLSGGDIETQQVTTVEECCQRCSAMNQDSSSTVTCVGATICGHREAGFASGHPSVCFLKSALIKSAKPVPAPKCDLVITRPDLLVDWSSPSTSVPAPPTTTVTDAQLSAIDAVWSGPPLKFIVGVLSARGNIERRQNLRNSWVQQFEQESVKRGQPSRVFFIIGNNFCRYSHRPGSNLCGNGKRQRPSSAEESENDRSLWEEQRVHGDLMFVDVPVYLLRYVYKMTLCSVCCNFDDS